MPPAFVIGAEGFHKFRANGEKVGAEIMGEVREALRRLEAATGRSFGGVDRPLLVSVRSGAAVSMPGMMDTVLNLGLTAPSAFAIALWAAARALRSIRGCVSGACSSTRFWVSIPPT